MSIAKKLQTPSGTGIRLINAPSGFTIDSPVKTAGDAVLLFARDSKQLSGPGKAVFEAAKQDKLAWIAYPKAGRLGTDLNRDRLAELARPMGIQPVRIVSLDDTWSALRFRPA